MKSLANRHNIFKVLPLIALFSCFFLSSCNENSSFSSFDAGPKSLKDAASSRSTTNLLDNSSLQRGCTAANAWAEEHADNLPTNFAAITEYPLEYRRAIFSKLTPEQKANVWTKKLSEVLNNVDLNREQHRLLEYVIENINPDLFDKNKEKNLIVGDNTLKKVFGETLAGNIFSKLNSMEELKENQAKSIVYGINIIGQTNDVVTASTGTADCGCSSSSDYCGATNDCSTGGAWTCEESDWGCGSLWRYGCDGRCTTTNCDYDVERCLAYPEEN